MYCSKNRSLNLNISEQMKHLPKKMEKLTAIVAMLVSISTMAQPAPGEINTVLIGLSFSPDMAYRTLHNSDGANMGSSQLDDRNDRESPRFGFTGGLLMGYNFSSRFGLETGLQYAVRGWQSVNSNPTFGDPIDPRRGVVQDGDNPLPSQITFRYHFHYLDIPLRAVFSFGTGKVRFISSLGVSTSILIDASQTSIVQYPDADTQRNTYSQDGDFEATNFFPTASAGMDYMINDKLNLRVEPTFRYGLVPINEAPVSSNLWSAGVNFTCYYVLK